MPRRHRALAGAAIGALALILTASALAARRLPSVLWHNGGRDNAFLVRPSSIYTTNDGSGVEGVLRDGGASVERGAGRGFLHWTSWTARSATGIGTQWVKLQTPTATSPWTREPLRIDLYRVRSGHFTRMRLRYRQSGRNGQFTECLQSYRGGYSWGTIYGRSCQ